MRLAGLGQFDDYDFDPMEDPEELFESYFDTDYGVTPWERDAMAVVDNGGGGFWEDLFGGAQKGLVSAAPGAAQAASTALVRSLTEESPEVARALAPGRSPAPGVRDNRTFIQKLQAFDLPTVALVAGGGLILALATGALKLR